MSTASGKNVQRLRHTFPVNAAARHLPRLFTEIERYLDFIDAARKHDDRDWLWKEYAAWKQIVLKRETLAERLSSYSMEG